MRDYNWRPEWSDAHSASADGTAGARAPSTGEIAMIPTPDAVRDALKRYDKLMEEWSSDSFITTLANAARAWLATQEAAPKPKRNLTPDEQRILGEVLRESGELVQTFPEARRRRARSQGEGS